MTVMKFHASNSLAYRMRQAEGRKVAAARRAGAMAITGQALWPDGRIGWAAITFPPAEADQVYTMLEANPTDPSQTDCPDGSIRPALLRFADGPAFTTGRLRLDRSPDQGDEWATHVRYGKLAS